MTAYSFFLFLHSGFRWAVLAAGVLALGTAVAGWARSRPFSALDERIQRAFQSVTNLQFMLGVALYFFFSPIVDAFWDAPGAAMKERTLRFFGIEHVTTVLVAVTVLHVGRARAKKASADRLRFRAHALGTFFTLALIASAIPWPGLRHGRPLARGFSAPEAPVPAVTASCAETFAARCSACHGAEGAGDGPAAAALKPPPRSFRERGWDAGKSDEALVAIIREGGARHGLSAAMPSHAELSDAELRGLVRCLRGFQSRTDR